MPKFKNLIATFQVIFKLCAAELVSFIYVTYVTTTPDVSSTFLGSFLLGIRHMTTLHGEHAKSSSSGRRQMLTTTNFLVLRYSEATTAAETAEKTECFKRLLEFYFRIDFAEEATLFTFPISDVILTLPKLQFQMRKTFYAFIKMQQDPSFLRAPLSFSPTLHPPVGLGHWQ